MDDDGIHEVAHDALAFGFDLGVVRCAPFELLLERGDAGTLLAQGGRGSLLSELWARIRAASA
jgi:hypothetical protein